MKKILNLLCSALVVAVALTSCKSHVPKEAKYIPKDANVVLILDPQQMQDKLQKGGISIDTLINRVFNAGEADAKDKAAFVGFRDSAGINWSEKWYFFTRQKINGDKSQSNSFTLIGGLKDAKNFETFLVKQLKNEGKDAKIVAEKEYKYTLATDNTIIAWNDDQLGVMYLGRTSKPVFDTTTMTFREPETPSNLAEEIKREMGRCFTQKVNESLADVKMFTEMFKDKADGYMFTSTNAALPALAMLPFQPPKLEEMLKDNYSTATLTFEDGRILMKGTAYTNQLLSSLLKKYAGPTVDLSLIESYPSQQVNGFMMFAFNPEIFGGVLQQLEMENLANNYLSKAGFTSQDLYKSLKGQIVVAVSDIAMPSAGPDPMDKYNEKSMVRKKSFAKMIFNAPVGDKTSFFKLMDLAAQQGYIVKENNTYKGGALLSMLGVYFQADEKNMIIASDSLTYAQYMAKTATAKLNKDVMDKVKGKAGAFYFDIANTVAAFTKDSSTSAAMGHYSHSAQNVQNTFKDVISTFDNFDGSSLKSVMEVRMQNEKQNSLVTLVSFITDIAVDIRAQKKESERMFPGGVPAIIRTN